MLISLARLFIVTLIGEGGLLFIRRWIMREVEQELFVQNLLQQERYRDPKRLCQWEKQAYSQNGQDGILNEIYRRIGPTGETSPTFVEIGAGAGLENNTAYLLLTGWSGLWIEGNGAQVEKAKETFASHMGKELKIKQLLVTKENIAKTLKEHEIPYEFSLLSIDVDRNTYYIWEALAEYRPRVVVIEYNAGILPSDDWKVPYDAQKSWNGTNYFGASLKAYEKLGALLGYSLVGCDITGTDCFFVRNDLLGEHFCAPYTAENHYEPARYFLHRRQGHVAGFNG